MLDVYSLSAVAELLVFVLLYQNIHNGFYVHIKHA